MWDRQYLKYWIKDRFGLARNKNDGLLTDDIIHECVDDSIRQVSDDCGTKKVTDYLPLRADQWQYPIPDDYIRMHGVWYIDDDGTEKPLDYMSHDQLVDWRSPTADTSDEPSFYAIGSYQSKVFHFYANAAPVYDYVPDSYVTEATIRTLIDSGMNFGKTLDGLRITPGCIVQNLTDGSYGYVEVLDITTSKASGTATSGSGSTVIEDTGKNFTALLVAKDDIICKLDSDSQVTAYAFVKTVGTTTITYCDYHDPTGLTKRFASGDSYKVGVAHRIRLQDAAPHPGLRDGATNDFTVGDVLCTMVGTTFTSTTVTGDTTAGVTVSAIAIASGGAHGKVTAVTSATVLTIDKWIGGTPAAGETITVRVCDQYQVESEYRTQRVLELGPTPNTSDAIGSESIRIVYYALPLLPTEDTDPIEMDERYKEPLLAALFWKASERWGKEFTYVANLELLYKNKVREFQGDLNRPPLKKPLTVWGNQNQGSRYGLKGQTPSGARYNY